jgi:hypothetical protein
MYPQMANLLPIAARDFPAFLAAYPAFGSTTRIDELRARAYARLDRSGHVYLDFAGGGLYAGSQVASHVALLEQESSATRTPATRPPP